LQDTPKENTFIKKNLLATMPVTFFALLRSTGRMKLISSVVLLLLVWLLLSRCFIMKERVSDAKGKAWFKNKNAELITKDTLIDGRHIHYAICGDAGLPTLVFIHGSPGSWFHYMQFMYNTAMLKKFRMVSFDRPGFGHSNFGKPMHLQAQSQLLLKVLQAIKGSQPMYLAGHSMGAPVVAQIAAYNPALAEKIILMAAPLDINMEAKEIWRHTMKVKPLFWLLPGAFQPSNTELLWLKKDLKPLGEDLKKITCNVLFIHGDKDTWVSIKNIAFGKQSMINAASITADTLHGADHQIPWKRREAVRDILLELY
jgi:pimeloyl-ACP methyl ester carboxylesterase